MGAGSGARGPDGVAARRRPPTMTDVARLAQVSHQTVSRVVNGSPDVRPDTAERVRSAIAELGYRRNISARLLAASRTNTIGVVTWGTGQFGPSQVLLALQEAAAEAGFRLVPAPITAITADAVRGAIEQVLEYAPEALVVLVPHETVLRIAQEIDPGVPVLVVEGDFTQVPLTASVDNVAGARLATRHLLDLGHRSVVHVAGPPGWAEATARIEGWRAELADAGVAAPPLRWAGDWSSATGYRLGRTLAREDDVTAVFAGNDQMALGLVAALRAEGRRVPHDVSVVGFDNLPEAAYFDPPLTTVSQDFGALGRGALGALAQVLTDGGPPEAVVVTPELVVRESTAPPPT